MVSGLSDHNLTNITAIAAVALGAKVIEKHFTLSRRDGGPDAAFSLGPKEFKQLVDDIKIIEKSLGQPIYKPAKQEESTMVFRKSLFVVEDVIKDQKFTPANIRSIRPGYGLTPKYYDEVIGKTAARNIKRGTPLSWGLIKK